MVEYSEIGEKDFYDTLLIDDKERLVKGFVTKYVYNDNFFDVAVRELILKLTKDISRKFPWPPVLITTREHWSGYSEYTITNEWSEIILTVPDWDWEQEWKSLGDFLRAVAEANPEAEGEKYGI